MHGYNGSANVGNHCVYLQSGNFGWGDFFLGLILWLSMTCIWWKVLLKLQPMSHSLSSLEGLVGGRFSLRFSPLICNHPYYGCVTGYSPCLLYAKPQNLITLTIVWRPVWPSVSVTERSWAQGPLRLVPLHVSAQAQYAGYFIHCNRGS